MLECEHFKLFLPLEEGDVVEFEGVEAQSVDVGFAFARSSIADPDIGDLGEFCEDDIAIFLYFFEVSVFEEIAKSLIFFVEGDILEDLIFGHFFLRIDLISFPPHFNFGRSLRHFLFLLRVEGRSKFLVCFRHHNSNIILTNL